MARKFITDQILKLYSKLGGNVSEVLGTRSNINFLGVGRSPEGFIDSTINIDAIGALGKNKVLEELKSSIGYLTADKLNDVQANKLLENMTKIDNVFNPKQVANIVDLGTGTKNLDQKGLASLRGLTDETAEVGPEIRQFNEDFAARVAADNAARAADESKTVFGLKDYDTTGMSEIKQRIIQLEEKLGRLDANAPGFRERAKPLIDEIEALQLQLKNVDDLPPPGSRGGADDIAAPVQQYTNEIDALETMVTNRAGNEFITAYVDDIYKNAGAVSSVDVPKKRASARLFLNSMLKKETDLLPPGKGGTLESVVSADDYKFITEGGGGPLGDPLVLVKKYFGDEIARRLPLDTRTEVIDTFVDNVRFTKDRAGRATDNPRFNPDDIPEFKHGGLAKILEV
tara:strand:+ start:42 stop:1241 length:1200 start_codon:yes stop_codon:yes gene_type:complete